MSGTTPPVCCDRQHVDTWLNNKRFHTGPPRRELFNSFATCSKLCYSGKARNIVISTLSRVGMEDTMAMPPRSMGTGAPREVEVL